MTEAEYALAKLAESRRQVEGLAVEAERTKRLALAAKQRWEQAVKNHFALEAALEGDGLPLFESGPDVEQG
jgi:hypothetical protein